MSDSTDQTPSGRVCPYAQMEWACVLPDGHEGPHRSGYPPAVPPAPDDHDGHTINLGPPAPSSGSPEADERAEDEFSIPRALRGWAAHVRRDEFRTAAEVMELAAVCIESLEASPAPSPADDEDMSDPHGPLSAHPAPSPVDGEDRRVHATYFEVHLSGDDLLPIACETEAQAWGLIDKCVDPSGMRVVRLDVETTERDLLRAAAADRGGEG